MPYSGIMKRQLSPIITVVALTLVTDIECGRPRLYVCPESFHLTWKELPPYTEMINNTVDGVLLRTFKTGLRSCCVQSSGEPRTPFVFSRHAVQQSMANESTAELVQFMLPVQRSKEARTYLGHSYVPVISSPGFALFVKPISNSFDILLHALKPVCPLFIVSLLAVAIAGVMFWMIEFVAAIQDGETPEPFSPGVWNGVWWAFISMTTIGYGDIAPKSRAGKVFAVVWVLSGIVLSGVVVSTISSVLIELLSPKVVKLSNQRVAVLSDSEEAKFSFRNHGITHEFSNVTDISKALKADEVNMAVIDVLVAARHHDQFKDFVLDRIIEEETNMGVVFLPKGVKYSPCFREYILNNQREIISTVSKIVKGSTYKSYSPVSPSSIIDPTIPAVQYTILGILALIFLLVLCGLLKDCMAPSNKSVLRKTQETWLLTECRRTYLLALADFLQALRKNCQDDMVALRKSEETWFTYESMSLNKIAPDWDDMEISRKSKW